MLKNHVQAFIVSSSMRKTISYKREEGQSTNFFFHIRPQRACNPTTYIAQKFG
jgi:hypothetical protein